jgi:hypothetical protein
MARLCIEHQHQENGLNAIERERGRKGEREGWCDTKLAENCRSKMNQSRRITMTFDRRLAVYFGTKMAMIWTGMEEAVVVVQGGGEPWCTPRASKNCGEWGAAEWSRTRTG